MLPNRRRDGLLLVVDDHFLLLDDRPTGPLPTVTPGQGGHPDDRGSLTVLAEQATTLEELRELNSYCSCYGNRSSGWRVALSSWPWLEGKPLLGDAPGCRLRSIEVHTSPSQNHLMTDERRA